MLGMFNHNLIHNRFGITTFKCRERVHKYYSGTIHFEHPLIDQHLEID
jgi:hypothetical protein